MYVLDDSYKRRVKELCDLIAKEQDHKRFSLLIQELNQLLDGVQTGSSKDSDGQADTPPPSQEPA